MWLVILLIAAVLFIVVATAKFKLHPFLALLIAAFGYGLFSFRLSLEEVVSSINAGFGGTIGYIGIVILFGTIIGAFLEKSGGAWRLAEGILKITGRGNVPLTMTVMGYVVSIPVFCDSGFVILSALNKALCKRAGISLATGAIALSLGLYATHTMVPPTPGPIAAAGILEADLGLVIVYGIIIAVIAAIAGWLFAITIASKVHIEPYKEGEAPAEMPSVEQAPAPFKSLLPILIPIILIVLGSIAKFPTKPLGEGMAYDIILFLGQPVVALGLGVILAFMLPKRLDKAMLSTTGWVGQAIVSAAIIIIITGSGGAFGKVLQNSGIADVIGGTLAAWNLGIILPLVIAAGIKTAQGSSTVSIITTASLMAPLLPALGLDGEAAKAVVVVAIGAGAMVVSHANDSYFWVVTQFSNMTPEQGYRLQSLGTLFQGIVAAICVWIIGMVVL